MKRCCECKKIVWPWQQSNISFSPIHTFCHQEILSEVAKDPEIRKMMAKEIELFQKKTGKRVTVKV